MAAVSVEGCVGVPPFMLKVNNAAPLFGLEAYMGLQVVPSQVDNGHTPMMHFTPIK